MQQTALVGKELIKYDKVTEGWVNQVLGEFVSG